MMQILGRRYDTGEPVNITVADGRVARIEPAKPNEGAPWVGPGLVDLQINGYGGQEFNDPQLDVDRIVAIGRAMDADGVTSYLPTATTHSNKMLSHVMATLAAACDSPEVSRRVPGFHLEGPYISPKDGPRGAHPLEHCRAPDWDEFLQLQDAAGGRIKILTLSPEYDDAPSFIEKVVARGVLVAIGHTAATSEQIAAAVDAGARMSTHLGNGAHGQLRRHPNYIWDQLADDRLVASLIADGHHLPPSVVKCFVRGKTLDHCVLVSDLVGMAGMPPGEYSNTSIGNIEILEGGRIVVAGQRQFLAGAGLPMTVGIANLMRFADVPLGTAVDLASRRPAELIDVPCGRLEVGAVADLILFDMPTDEISPIQVRATVNAGEVVFGRA
ncbi:MAG: amidohydrolase family protein [Pirellulaceae bacterium]|nr:N-acetylglucosamine-6-phosphate deacetylase [Planctomycetaceae bacterium]MDP6555164.1 amidohydrolase family protein [Pirellulaceae bacterium]